MIKNLLPALAAVAILGVGTYFHARYTERFAPMRSESLDKFTARVPTVPNEIGPWVGTDDEIDPEEFKLTNCTAYIQRTYRHKETGQAISLYLVSGSGRNITIHTPDWCYRAKGFLQDADEVVYSRKLPNSNSEVSFATAVFRTGPEAELEQPPLRILWTYSADGRWQGPSFAKMVLTTEQALYKIYVIMPIPEGESTAIADTPIPDFIDDAFPVINAKLFPPKEETSKPTETEA